MEKEKLKWTNQRFVNFCGGGKSPCIFGTLKIQRRTLGSNIGFLRQSFVPALREEERWNRLKLLS